MYKNQFIMLLLAVFLVQGCSQKEDFSFVFMTDIHVEEGRNAITGFNQAIARVNELDPDFVITGGDLIMDALGQTFNRADSLYNIYDSLSQKIEAPVYNTIGNHEVFGIYEKGGVLPDNPFYGKEMFKNRVHKETYYSFDFQNWHFMVLDVIGIKPEERYFGYVDPAQIDWIKSDLAKLDKSTPIVISAHIPFVNIMTSATEKSADEGIIVTNGLEVLKLFSDYNLKLVLQGHMHTLEEIIIKDIHFITCGAVSGHWWLGDHQGFEEGFGLFKVSGDDFTWQYIDYGWEVPKQ
ncbi:MAG: metallophosphoesterase [Candidatus Marinimicrobia bacterium]|nr:metallophosphoesterase [Candidatus Neomarinimicrobiota bacterium]